MFEPEANKRQERPVAEALAASAGMVLFAFFSHQGLPWTIISVVGLLVTAVTIEQSFRSATSMAGLLGLSQFSRRGVLFAAVGCAVGAGFGVLYRISQGMSVFPASGLEAFVAVACLIGATEELLYRGWVQGRLRVLGWPAAVVFAAASHAAYKTALFAWPPDPMYINYSFVALWTFVGGIIFGLIREFSGTVVPLMLAHAMFDLLVYGAVARAPWWVWT
jgi:membrane protease YdiL (CAAX protease family)